LTRALGALAVSHLAEVPLEELGSYITDGAKDGGIDLIYFDSKERTLYLVQTKWHEDGHGSLELGDALKFIEGVRKVLDNDLDQLNERIKARKADIERAVFDANAKFVLVVAHTGQEQLSPEVANEPPATPATERHIGIDAPGPRPGRCTSRRGRLAGPDLNRSVLRVGR
jgi:hypothetical protein